MVGLLSCLAPEAEAGGGIAAPRATWSPSTSGYILLACTCALLAGLGRAEENEAAAHAGGARGAPKAKGKKARRTVQEAMDRGFIDPEGTGRPLSEEGPPQGLRPNVGAAVEAFVEEKQKGRYAEGTKESHKRGWARWTEWRDYRRAPRYLVGETKAERMADEEELLLWGGYLGWLGRAPGTLATYLFAVQRGHLDAGAGDPLEGKQRVWDLIEGLRRTGEVTPRKLGVTPAMLRWLQVNYDLRGIEGCGGALGVPLPRKQQGKAHKGDRRVLGALLLVAFFFLLRAGDYSNTGRVDPDKIIRGKDFAFKKDGLPVTPTHADEVGLNHRKSKTDQRSFGTYRAHFRAEDPLCVVQALALLWEVFPERFADGAESHLPLFRWGNGDLVHRDEVQRALQEAATAVGLPAERFKPHSLRIGGASALYHATGEIEVVKRFGCWTSSAFHEYLWDSAEQYKGIAEKMAKDVATIHYT